MGMNEIAENYRILVEAIHKVLQYALEALRKVEMVTVETTN